MGADSRRPWNAGPGGGPRAGSQAGCVAPVRVGGRTEVAPGVGVLTPQDRPPDMGWKGCPSQGLALWSPVREVGLCCWPEDRGQGSPHPASDPSRVGLGVGLRSRQGPWVPCCTLTGGHFCCPISQMSKVRLRDAIWPQGWGRGRPRCCGGWARHLACSRPSAATAHLQLL